MTSETKTKLPTVSPDPVGMRTSGGLTPRAVSQPTIRQAADRRETMTTYICAIETGSFSAGANRTYERRSDKCVCGRAHRSYSAAQACMDRLRKANDAAWLSAHIHDDDGHRAA